MVKYAATLALLSVAIMCGTVSYSVVTVNKHVSETLMKLDTEIDEAHRLTLEAGLTVMEARKASVKEIAYLDAWNKGISRTLIDFHDVMVETRSAVGSIQPVAEQATSTLKTTQQTIAQLQLPIAQMNSTIAQFQGPIAQLNTDLEALQPVFAHTDTTVVHLAGITGDFQHTLHPILNPDPCKTRGCRIKRVFKIILGATSAGEGAYYTGQLFREIL